MIGSINRCEYVVLGPAVNLAARLMGVSMKTKKPGVIVDEAMFKNLRLSHSFDFGPEEERTIKGFGQTKTFAVSFNDSSSGLEIEDDGSGIVVGREEEVRMCKIQSSIRASTQSAF